MQNVKTMDPEAFRKAEAAGLVFDAGKSTLLGCCRKEITEVVIPEGVTLIGDCAFADCAKLVRVVMPDSLRGIDEFAFRGCTRLSDAVIPDGVAMLGQGAFQECTALSSMVIPQSIGAIEMFAFINCTGLETVVIPDGVMVIGDYAFANCTRLKSADIPAGVAARCRILIAIPTVVCPFSSSSSTLEAATPSKKATRNGVAKTGCSSPDIKSSALLPEAASGLASPAAVISSVTLIVNWRLIPNVSMLSPLLLNRHFYHH